MSFCNIASDSVADKLLVASIDFGTAFSGYAFQFKHEYKERKTKIKAKNWNNGTNISNNTPTNVLIQPDGETFQAFGYDAENEFTDLVLKGEDKKWYYFTQFKMSLYENMKLKRGFRLEALNGKELSAIVVFTVAIKYMKEQVLEECRQKTFGPIRDTDALWVLTVPAIWTDEGKQFMREAGLKAGIDDKDLLLALEPEAASIFCKYDFLQGQDESFGSKYIVVDAGGGTVDMTAHAIQLDGNIKELHRPCGGYWGGATINTNFTQFLSDVFGSTVMKAFQKDAPDEYVNLLRMFEVKKREVSVTNNNPTAIEVPCALAQAYTAATNRPVQQAVQYSKYADNESVTILKNNKLKIDADIMRDFFSKAISNVVKQVDVLLKDDFVKPCGTILLVGGFSESPILRENLEASFRNVKIINPGDSSLVVLKGAVLFGRERSIISHRVCRYTYGYEVLRDVEDEDEDRKEYMTLVGGVRKCRKRFHMIVHRGDTVKTDDTHYSSTVSIPQTGEYEMAVDIYRSSEYFPRYVTERGCVKVGELSTISLKGEKDLWCRVGGMFGGTEIHMEIVHEATGKVVSKTFDNLE